MRPEKDSEGVGHVGWSCIVHKGPDMDLLDTNNSLASIKPKSCQKCEMNAQIPRGWGRVECWFPELSNRQFLETEDEGERGGTKEK